MEIIKDVLTELFSMFVTDMRLTLVTLALVALVAVLLLLLHISAMICGLLLLVGCFAILIEATYRETKARAVKR